MPLIHKTLCLVKEAVVVVVGGGGGGGSKYYGHYKMTPHPQLQNSRCYLACPVCTFEWFIHIILFPLGLGGGGHFIMAIIF